MAATAENASIISNGSFESYTGFSPGGGAHGDLNSSRKLVNWTWGVNEATSGNKATIASSGDSSFLNDEEAPDGTVVMCLQRDTWLSQPINVPTTGVYEVTFLHRKRKRYADSTIHGVLDGKEFGYAKAVQTNVFSMAHMKVYATAGTHTLVISNGVSSAHPVIDKVEMSLMTANLVSNPSFEDYVYSSSFSDYKTIGATDFPEAWPWSGDLRFAKGTSFATAGVPDGEMAIALRASASISQNIIAPTTGVYEVTFKYGNRSATGNGNTKAFAFIDDEPLGSVTMWTNAIQTAHFYTDLAAGQSYMLTITNNATSTGTGTDFLIDLVSVAFTTNIIKNGGFDGGSIGNKILSTVGNRYLQANQSAYSNPFWTSTGSTGRTGLSQSGASWVNAVLDVGTYALYIQTLPTAGDDVSVSQDFSVTNPGVYSLSFRHACRNSSKTPYPETRVRIYSGNGTSGSVVFEGTVTSSVANSWTDYLENVEIPDAGAYTLEFFRAGRTTADVAAVIDDVCLAWQKKICKGFTLIVR